MKRKNNAVQDQQLAKQQKREEAQDFKFDLGSGWMVHGGWVTRWLK